MTPIDPQGAAEVGKTAVEQGSELARFGKPMITAFLAYSLLLIPKLMSVDTWRGRMGLYVTQMSSGAGAAFACMLSLPLLGMESSAEAMIISGMVGFHLGKDGLEKLASVLIARKGLR